MPDTMTVCVCGWHFTDRFYLDDLPRIASDFPVFIVANRPDEILKDCGMPYSIRENIGIDFGAYNHFLMKFWNGGSVLFTHDDTRFSPVASAGEIVPGQESLRQAAALECDQAYIFSSPAEDRRNAGKHGRMLWMSEKLLSWFKGQDGFFYDENNHGHVGGVAPEGCGHYNLAPAKNHQMMGASGMDVHRKLYLPAVDMAIRGRFGGNQNG